MSESASEVMVYINQVPYSVDEAKRISYNDVLKVTKKPQGSTVFYIDTKGKLEERRAGYLEKGKSIAIADGLNISSFSLVELLKEEGEEA